MDGMVDALLAIAFEFGLFKAAVTVLFFGAHWWVFHLYMGRISDMQKQIDRLADENHEWRDRFQAIVDHRVGYNAETRKIEEGK